MSDTQADYIRTDQLDDALVPLDTVAEAFNVSRWTIDRWLSADNVERHPYPGGKAVRWGDIPKPSNESTRWHRQQEAATTRGNV